MKFFLLGTRAAYAPIPTSSNRRIALEPSKARRPVDGRREHGISVRARQHRDAALLLTAQLPTNGTAP